MERRGAKWNGEEIDGMKGNQMERKWIRWNRGIYGTEAPGPDGKEGHKMEWRLTRWNGEGPDGTERDQMERRVTR